jgi:hypothetical protein
VEHRWLEGCGPHQWSERQPMACGLEKVNTLQVTSAENDICDLTTATLEAASHVADPSIRKRECGGKCCPEHGGQIRDTRSSRQA